MTTDSAAIAANSFDWKKYLFMGIGVFLFVLVYYSPPWPDAIDPQGKGFALTPEGKGALAVFLLAATWWVFEVIPIGVTSLTIGVLQVLFFIRPAKDAFKDFMDPSVLFIFGSIVVGLVFTKTGLTRRIAYRMLGIVGEKTSMIYLGCFVLTSALTHIMAHTAVAATIYPLLVAIYAMYGEGDKPTKFGKGLFIGMAYIAGAGSIVTLLGAARGAVALGFYNEVAGKTVGFFELSYYMAPIGWLMTFLLWGFFMVVMKPEKATIPGLREKAKRLSKEMGGITKNEIIAAVIVITAILVLGVSAVMKSTIPEPPHKTAVLLTSTILFFATGILDIDDLEEIPWNIILLFAGAMSIGFCLWETGAAKWLAVNWLAMFKEANWFVFSS
jgi:sodium-dependent dicarboxylate transporter 2/3/5